jgi:hypothetical protein
MLLLLLYASLMPGLRCLVARGTLMGIWLSWSVDSRLMFPPVLQAPLVWCMAAA